MPESRENIESAIWFRRQVTEAKPLAQDREAWERQPHEGRKAYAAFVLYVEMGPADRSYAKVAQELARSKTLMQRWGKRWQWVSRSEAKDTDEDRRRAAHIREKRRDMADRHQRMALAGLTAVVKRLVGVKKEDGSGWDITPLNPAILDAFDVAKLAETFVKIERLALELPTERHDVGGEIQATATVTHDEHRTIELILQDPTATALAARLLEQVLQPAGARALGSGGVGDLRE